MALNMARVPKATQEVTTPRPPSAKLNRRPCSVSSPSMLIALSMVDQKVRIEVMPQNPNRARQPV